MVSHNFILIHAVMLLFIYVFCCCSVRFVDFVDLTLISFTTFYAQVLTSKLPLRGKTYISICDKWWGKSIIFITDSGFITWHWCSYIVFDKIKTSNKIRVHFNMKKKKSGISKQKSSSYMRKMTFYFYFLPSYSNTNTYTYEKKKSCNEP